MFWSISFLTSEVVVVVPEDELLDDSSLLEQEMMMVAEKQEIRNIYKNISILFLNTKSKKLQCES